MKDYCNFINIAVEIGAFFFEYIFTNNKRQISKTIKKKVIFNTELNSFGI